MDNGQIPPVGKKQKTGESNAIPFVPERQKSHQIGFLEITEPQRQVADSPIILYAHAIRNQKMRQKIDFDFKEEYKNALEVVPRNRESMEFLVLKYFRTEEFQKDPDYCKILAWRNATVLFFNNMVREVIYGSALLPKIMLGEKLVMDEPLVKGDRVVLAKNEDVKVSSVAVVDYELKYKLIENNVFGGTQGYDPLSETEKNMRVAKIKVYAVQLVNDDGDKFMGNIVHEHSEKLYNDIRESTKKAALRLTDRFEKAEMWREFYHIQQKFLWVGYNYALSIHKSQGSTYQYVISNEWDIDVNKDIEERQRIRYVSSTRAKHKLFVVR